MPEIVVEGVRGHDVPGGPVEGGQRGPNLRQRPPELLRPRRHRSDIRDHTRIDLHHLEIWIGISDRDTFTLAFTLQIYVFRHIENREDFVI